MRRFVFHTKTDATNQDLKEINHEMDFSGYDKNLKCYDATNKKVLGKFKDEVGGKVMTGFKGLRPKCYALKSMAMIQNIRSARALQRTQ